MANTTNFGWETPDDTDLVKDGALAMRTLGNAIDTSLVDLKGGTTGQILSKNTNTDMDFVWINNDQGDITAVTAGVGLSGGGTSGAVTLTNTVATTFDAAGDLVYGTGADTFTKLSLGTAGQILTVNSGATAPEWKTPASSTPNFVGCYLQKSANQTIANVTVTAVTWDVETLDTDGFHSNTTNTSRITIPAGKAGKYQIGVQLTYDANSSGSRQILIAKNGTTFSWHNTGAQATGNSSVTRTIIVDLAVGDYIEIQAYQSSSANRTLFSNAADTDLSNCYAYYLGA